MKNKDISNGITLVFEKFTHDPKTGKRTKSLGYEEVKFKDGDGERLSNYYKKHCHQRHLKDMGERDGKVQASKKAR